MYSRDYNKTMSSSASNANDTIVNNKDDYVQIQTMPIVPTPYCLNSHNEIKIINITITNVVFSFNVNSHLNLKYLARNGLNVEYKRNQKKLIMRIRKPQTLANIHSSGKIVCLGCPSEHDAKIASRRIGRIIQRLIKDDNFRIQINNFKILNVHGYCTVPYFIRIVEFTEKYNLKASYVPELVTGVIYKIKQLKATLIIFSNGTITIFAPSEAVVQQSIEHIYPLLLPFWRRKNEEIINE